MQNRKILLFDWDDTLVKSTSKFVEVKEKIANEIIKYISFDTIRKYTLPELIDRFDEIEYSNMQKYNVKGYKNFKASLMEVAQEVLGYDFYYYSVYEYIDSLVTDLSENKVEYVDFAELSIRTLYDRGYEMYIVTKANKEDQKMKVEQSTIVEFFKGVFFLDQKNEESYLKVLSENKWPPEVCTMIGNSPKSDINPCIRIGMETILILNEKTWKFEEEGLLHNGEKTIVLHSIKELLEIYK